MISPFILVQFSHSVMSNSLQLHGLQHARPPCPSPTPRTCSNSCPSSWWCHPTVSSSVTPFSSCLQSFLASGYSPVSQLFASGESFSFNIIPSNEYSGLISFRIAWFDLAVQGTLKSLLQHHSWKASILWCLAFFIVQLSHRAYNWAISILRVQTLSEDLRYNVNNGNKVHCVPVLKQKNVVGKVIHAF